MQRYSLLLSTVLASCWLLILTPVVSPTTAQAQSMFDVTVSPPTAYLNLLQGSQGSHAITITNNSQKELRMLPKIVDSRPQDFASVPQLGSELSFPYLVGDQTNLSPLIIPPEGTGVLRLYFDVPTEALSQEYSLTILFASSQADAGLTSTTLSLNNSESLVTGAVASNLVVFVGEQSTNPQLQIVDIGTPLLVDSLRPLIIKPIIRNFGPHAAVASGSAEMSNWRHQQVAQAQLYPMVVLAGQKQNTLVLPDFTPGGELPAPVNFTYRSPFLLGPYHVEVTLSDASGRVYAATQSTVYALPISISIIIVCIFVLIWVFRKYVRHYWSQFD